MPHTIRHVHFLLQNVPFRHVSIPQLQAVNQIRPFLASGNVPRESLNQGKKNNVSAEGSLPQGGGVILNIMMLGLKATLFSNSGYFLPGFRCLQGTYLALCFRGSAEWRRKLWTGSRNMTQTWEKNRYPLWSALLSHEVICSGRFLSKWTHGSYTGGCGSEGQFFRLSGAQTCPPDAREQVFQFCFNPQSCWPYLVSKSCSPLRFELSAKKMNSLHTAALASNLTTTS